LEEEIVSILVLLKESLKSIKLLALILAE